MRLVTARNNQRLFRAAPGTAMGFPLRDSEERADVIAYRKQRSH